MYFCEKAPQCSDFGALSGKGWDTFSFLLPCCLSCLSALSNEEGRFFFLFLFVRCLNVSAEPSGSGTNAQLPNASLFGRHHVGICPWQNSHASPPLSSKREGPTRFATPVDSYLLSDLPLSPSTKQVNTPSSPPFPCLLSL